MTLPTAPMPTVEYLRECLDYDAEHGTLKWKNRPSHHFQSELAAARWNARLAGIDAFMSITTRGYRHGKLNFKGKTYELLAHRVALALQEGAWPEAEVDHRNQDKSDLRASNLRNATRNFNGFNIRRSNAAGFVGVQKSGSGYSAKIRNGDKKVYLGTYPTAEIANRIYRQAALLLHGVARPHD